MGKKIVLFLLKIYQYFSRLTPASCRYYPTCSEYSRQQFVHNSFFKAIWYSITRILSCNQLFVGGIDYPIVKRKFFKCYKQKLKNEDIRYWFVPTKDKNYYYVIQVFEKV